MRNDEHTRSEPEPRPERGREPEPSVAAAAPAGFTLCSLLWARPGLADELAVYEDRVLDLLPEHGIEVLHRARIDRGPDHPVEVHLYAVPSEASLEAYLADPRRLELAAERDRVVARTEVFRAAGA
ncbi:hypothetical protein ACFPER_09825 [Agromyces aurantiacus]|uniref:DUF1330 domain-containing protein n=1 Tax=Agromyces aurantiacus TaxID=165814 RepID=A0ABV9R5U6_9MICO|nr:hypothetical protein [Agromyces aurantiacus]MBM7503772.1 hypothetical protein [Agromyces aurantiacus]